MSRIGKLKEIQSVLVLARAGSDRIEWEFGSKG